MSVDIHAGIYVSDLHGVFHACSGSSPTATLKNDFSAEFLGAGTAVLAGITSIVLLDVGQEPAQSIAVSPSQWTVSAGTAWMSAGFTQATPTTIALVGVMAGAKTYFTANLLATLQPGMYNLRVTISVSMQWALTLFIELYKYAVYVNDVALRSEILRRIVGQRTSALYIATAVALYGSTAPVSRTGTGYYASLNVEGVNNVVIYLYDAVSVLATLQSDSFSSPYSGSMYLTVSVVV